MDINGYLTEIRALSQSGQATEHSYRPALERLFKSIDPALTVINEPRRLTDVGAPDFVFNRNGVSIGWCEAKDLTKEITNFKTGDYSKEQKARYAKGLPNLIYTNGSDFEFIRKGEVTGFVSIADLIPTLPARPEEFPRLEMLLKDFASQTPISINTAKQLAEMMAGKAVLIKDRIGNSLMADTAAKDDTDLVGQFQAFKTHLIHDITIADFADIYAETIAYGLFAARLHDTSLGTFNRQEALELLPKSNPFLRSLFVYIAGPNLDDRLRGIIDDLCQVFKACDVPTLMQDFGKWTARNDPFLHFYETFLAEYNPAKRKARGVWYTPEPVVNFIVRAVDDVLKTEFGLPMGLADTSKVKVKWDTRQNDKKGDKVFIEKEVHRVQILDPATGTGTFLAEAIKQIAAQVKGVAEGMWSSYVERDLIPRLHGFELLMASYAMCHMKLDMMLTDMGYKPSANPPRLGVYLTNSLEEGEQVEQTLFGLARDITKEARAASEIKNDMPIMCVIGNPPYSSSSQNQGGWITNLISEYKQNLGERKINLDDDYIKFIRVAENFIENNKTGVVGLITNNSYLDGVTHRTMRHHLLQTFDKIYVFNLHGDTRSRREGVVDQNVFDIMQGVAIVLMVKLKSQSSDGKVFYTEMFGTRNSKNESLWESSLASTDWNEIKSSKPYCFFVPKDLTGSGDTFNLDDFFAVKSSGIQSKNDSVTVCWSASERDTVIEDFLTLTTDELVGKYPAGEVWKHAAAATDLKNGDFEKRELLYRVFDKRHSVLTRRSGGFLGRPRYEVMQHMQPGNIALMVNKKHVGDYFSHVSVTNLIATHGTMYLGNRGQDYLIPLYLYPEEGTLETERRVNFDPKIYAEIRERAGLIPPSPSGEGTGVGSVSQTQRQPDKPHPNPSPEGEGLIPDELRVFDYIYGVLHSPDYRRTYAQFLKIDFPRIPYPASPEVFAHVAEKGGQLRRLHLMEDAAIGATPYPFKGDGDNVVVKPALSEDGRVMINPDQYFEGVPQIAWEFHIGGYQPAQKWLKDRKGRALSFDDVLHYQKIIKILCETDRIMKEIELPL